MRICLYNDNGVSVIYNTDTAGLERLDKNDPLMDGAKPRRAICEIGMIDVPGRLVIPNLFGGMAWTASKRRKAGQLQCAAQRLRGIHSKGRRSFFLLLAGVQP